MTSVFGGFGKRGTTGVAAGSGVPGFPNGPSGLPGGVSPTEGVHGRVTVDLSGPPLRQPAPKGAWAPAMVQHYLYGKNLFEL